MNVLLLCGYADCKATENPVKHTCQYSTASKTLIAVTC